jgi:hypothetical protein
MRGYAQLGVQHIMFQCEPDTLEAHHRLTEALQLYRGSGQPVRAVAAAPAAPMQGEQHNTPD